MYAEDLLHTVLWAVPVSSLEARERAYFDTFASECETVVLGHHVTTMAEWTWCVRGGVDGEGCAADDHTQAVCAEWLSVPDRSLSRNERPSVPGCGPDGVGRGDRDQCVSTPPGVGTVDTSARYGY